MTLLFVTASIDGWFPASSGVSVVRRGAVAGPVPPGVPAPLPLPQPVPQRTVSPPGEAAAAGIQSVRQQLPFPSFSNAYPLTLDSVRLWDETMHCFLHGLFFPHSTVCITACSIWLYKYGLRQLISSIIYSIIKMQFQYLNAKMYALIKKHWFIMWLYSRELWHVPFFLLQNLKKKTRFVRTKESAYLFIILFY